MLNVQKFLRDELANLEKHDAKSFGFVDPELQTLLALDVLEAQYGIKYNVWEQRLIVLNYNQIESSKFHPITIECRSLVLDFKTLEVVSRSFDRFFNYGEDERIKGADITTLIAHEKIDGSLIGLFNFEGEWMWRTKSMINPSSIINNNVGEVTWMQQINAAVDTSYAHGTDSVDPAFTYILELTCRENRVVTKYEGDSKLWLLAIRNNETGEYDTNETGNFAGMCGSYGWLLPKPYKFDTFEACALAAKELRNLQEGYVLYDHVGVPCIKLKNPAYVAAHHLRGEGCLTEKRILDLIVMNETDEYLSIFPEDFKAFEKYLDAASVLELELNCLESSVKSRLFANMEQKEFAMQVKDEPYAAIAFGLKKGKSLKECKERLTRNATHNMILAYTITTTETL